MTREEALRIMRGPDAADIFKRKKLPPGMTEDTREEFIAAVKIFANAEPDDIGGPFTDFWDAVEFGGEDKPNQVYGKAEAEAELKRRGLEDSHYVKPVTGGFQIAPKEAAESGKPATSFNSREEADAALRQRGYDPERFQVSEAPDKGGWAISEREQPEQAAPETMQDPKTKQWFARNSAGGWSTFDPDEQEGYLADDVEIINGAYFVRDARTGQLQQIPTPSPLQQAQALAVSGDIDGAMAWWNVDRAVNQGKGDAATALQMALDIARSPADVFTLSAIARGEIKRGALDPAGLQRIGLPDNALQLLVQNYLDSTLNAEKRAREAFEAVAARQGQQNQPQGAPPADGASQGAGGGAPPPFSAPNPYQNITPSEDEWALPSFADSPQRQFGVQGLGPDPERTPGELAFAGAQSKLRPFGEPDPYALWKAQQKRQNVQGFGPPERD